MSVKKSKTVSRDLSFLGRVYRYLPFFLVSLSFLNVWFLYSFVRREKEDLTGQREKIETCVSNAFSFVMLSLSNEISRVRHSNEMRLRPVFTRSLSSPSVTNLVNGTSSHLPSESSYSGFSPPVEIVANYFSFNGVPYLQFEDGGYSTVGDDFGYGVCTRITRFSVVCADRWYRLRSFVRRSPVFSEPSKIEVVKNE